MVNKKNQETSTTIENENEIVLTENEKNKFEKDLKNAVDYINESTQNQEEVRTTLNLRLGADLVNTLVDSDLPVSKLFEDEKLSVRVAEQVFITMDVNYPIVNLVLKTQRSNGVFDVFYRDYRKTETDIYFQKGDTTIEDFNAKPTLIYRETPIVDINYHNKFKMFMSTNIDISVASNLATLTLYINSIEMGYIRDFNRSIYASIIKRLSDPNSYDKKVNVALPTDKDSTNTVAQTIFQTITSLKTPSRKHITRKPKDALQSLEYQYSGGGRLLFNLPMASQYKYNLTSGTFQLGEIKMPTEIEVVDFSLLEDYESSSSILKDAVAIFIPDNLIEMFYQFQANTSTKVPRGYTIIHFFCRYGIYIRKDAPLIIFNQAMAA